MSKLILLNFPILYYQYIYILFTKHDYNGSHILISHPL